MKRRNLISMMIAMVLCLSFMTTTGFAEQIINKLVIQTNIDEVLKAEAEVQDLTISVKAPDYPDLAINASFEGWYERPEIPDAHSLPEKYEGENFIEGDTYFYKMKISVKDSEYKFASSLNINLGDLSSDFPLKEGEENEFDLPSAPYKATETGPELIPPEPFVPGEDGPGEPGGPDVPPVPDPGEPGGPGGIVVPGPGPGDVKIIFDFNNGKGDKFDSWAPKDEDLTVPDYLPTGISAPDGKELYGWDVNGETKKIGETYRATEDLILKALWKDKETPEIPETPDPYYPGYYDDWYDWYEPSEPSQTKVDQAKKDDKPEEKKEEKTETKPEKIVRKVILTLGSKTLDSQVNGVDSFTEMDVAAYAKDGRTMLPIRFVAEALGMGVRWDAKTRTVIIEDLLFKVEIPIDTNKIIVNGETYTSDVKPEIVDGRTMMPIANIARALGLKDGQEIFWDKDTKQVTIIRTISR